MSHADHMHVCYVIIEIEHVKKSEMQISINSEACGAHMCAIHVIIEREHMKKSEMQVNINSEACGAHMCATLSLKENM